MAKNGHSKFLYWRLRFKMNLLNRLAKWFRWLGPIKLVIHLDGFSEYENEVTIYTHDCPHGGDYLNLYMGFSGHSEQNYCMVTKVVRFMPITPLAHLGNVGQVIDVYCKKVDGQGDRTTDGADNPIAEYANYYNDCYMPSKKRSV